MDWTLFARREMWLATASIFSASLIGSGHCVLMCGPFAVRAAQTWTDMAIFHATRLGGYLLLGAAAGSMGSALNTTREAKLIVLICLIAVYIQCAWRLWQGRDVILIPAAWIARLRKMLLPRAKTDRADYPLVMGLSTALLPCGWLHGFVLVAIAGGNWLMGALTMVVFWLGTLPALISLSRFFNRLLFRFPIKQRAIVCLLFLMAGMCSLIWRGRVLFVDEKNTPCPICRQGESKPTEVLR